MGKPVVVGASDTSGLREQIVPKGPARCGAYVDPGDPCTIASAVFDSLRDCEGFSRQGRNGREHALRRFAWVVAAELTMAVHRDAVTNHRTAAQPDRRVPVPIPL